MLILWITIANWKNSAWHRAVSFMLIRAWTMHFLDCGQVVTWKFDSGGHSNKIISKWFRKKKFYFFFINISILPEFWIICSELLTLQYMNVPYWYYDPEIIVWYQNNIQNHHIINPNQQFSLYWHPHWNTMGISTPWNLMIQIRLFWITSDIIWYTIIILGLWCTICSCIIIYAYNCNNICNCKVTLMS